MRLKIEMERRGILQEEKYLFSQWWGNLWGITGKNENFG